ncbi:sigma-70 family RNA polymerase sigma factor [Streptomyces sp. NPDC020362]|uniref:sigma-70 family RNA polymerase sigma factor n=1 Tax=unclassified Streptomyces TaxID=2593676 RepID=UPI003401194E
MMGEPTPVSGDLGGKGNDAPVERPDMELIERARAGDDAAFGALYERHFESAYRLARRCAPSPADAEDVASEGFAQVLSAIRAGGGPRQVFRPYLLTTVRRIAAGAAARGKRSTPTAELETYAPPVSFEDPVLADLEASLVGRAFAALPERWQTVLWYTVVEGENPAQVAPRLGLSANATAALASRAREGLRTEYLQAHLSAGDLERECRKCASKLSAYLRGSLGARDRRHVEGHLAGCRRCSGPLLELREVSGRLRGMIGPLVVGPARLGHVTSRATASSQHSAGGAVRPNRQHPENAPRSSPGRGGGIGPRAVGAGISMAAGLAVLATVSSPLPSTGTASEHRAYSRTPGARTAPAPQQPDSPRPTPPQPVAVWPVGHPAEPRSNRVPVPPPSQGSATHGAP